MTGSRPTWTMPVCPPPPRWPGARPATSSWRGELLASQGRTLTAADAFHRGDSEQLRAIVEAEIEERIRQQEISGRIGWGAGINPILVDEDIQNMRLYLSRDDFPDTPDEVFHFTHTPYSAHG